MYRMPPCQVSPVIPVAELTQSAKSCRRGFSTLTLLHTNPATKDVAQRDLLRAPPHHVVGNTIGQLCDVVKQGRQLGKVISDELLLAAIPLA